jgi:hypothetical protein
MAINPTVPCKVFLFDIGKSINDRESVYAATREGWSVNKFLDASE